MGIASLLSSFSTFLYGVGTADPITFVSVSLVLTGVAIAASYIPARRAARVDPISAVREELTRLPHSKILSLSKGQPASDRTLAFWARLQDEP